MHNPVLRTLRVLTFWGCCLIGAGLLIKLVALRLNAIDMTDMRFLVENWTILGIFVVVLFLAFVTQDE